MLNKSSFFKNFTLFTFLISFSFICIFSFIQNNIFIFLSYLFLFVFGFLFFIKSNLNIKLIFVLSYSSNVITCVILFYILIFTWGDPYWGGGSDDLQYENLAKDIVDSNISIFNYFEIKKSVIPKYHNSSFYPYVISLLMKFISLFGDYHTIIPRLLNSMFLAFTAVLVFLASLKLDLTKKISTINAITVSTFPIMMWVSAHVLRDTLISFITFAIFYLWLSKNSKFQFSIFNLSFISIILISALLELRLGQGILIIMIIFLHFFVNLNKNILVIFFILLSTIILFFYSGLILDKIYIFVDDIQIYREYRTRQEGLSNYILNLSLLPLGIILRFFYLLITPFPSFNNIESSLLSIGTIVQFYFLPFLFLGIIQSAKDNSKRLLLFFFLGLFLSIVIFTFTPRQITQYVPYGIILISIAYQNYKINKYYLFLLMTFLIILLSTFYIFLKFIL